MAPRLPARLTRLIVGQGVKKAKIVISLAYFVVGALGRLGQRLVGHQAPGRLVVIYYHAIPGAARRGFARQMDALARSARVVPADYVGTLESGERLVAITFDDAFQSVADHALPELLRRSLPATIFVPVGVLAKGPSWEDGASGSGEPEHVMSEKQLRALPSDVVDVGSHSISHPHLTRLDETGLSEEIAGSRHRLETLLGRPVVLFAPPFGEHDHSVVQQCRRAGYERVFSIVPRLVDPAGDAFVRGRVSVDPRDGALEFFLKTSGAYAWMPYASALKRAFKP